MFDAHAHLKELPPPSCHGVILPGIHPRAHPAKLLADPRVHAAVGLHPWHVPEDLASALSRLEALAESTSPVAIGETGLDRSRRGAPRDRQEAAFRAQIRLAKRLGLPLVLHVVRSHGACLAALQQEGFEGGGMVHDFQGPIETIAGWTRAGFALSISPRGIHKTSILAGIPDPWLLVETDDAGTERLPEVISAVAEARGTSPAAVAEQTGANARRMVGGTAFPLDIPPPIPHIRSMSEPRVMPSALPGPTARTRKGAEPTPVDPTLAEHETLPRQQRRFDRSARLLGDRAMNTLLQAHVIVFGVGGVGSFAIEALARSGVGRLTLVDFDDVCVTNTNRQLHALKSTVGRAKVEVMAERCRDINPRVLVTPRELFYEAARADELLPSDHDFDFAIDAIDNITAKCHLLDRCRRLGLPVVASMGAAARFDPTALRVADLRDTYNDPFARDVRGILRKKYGWDLSEDTGVPCVFSVERPSKPTALHYDVSVGGFQCVCPPKEDRPHTCDDRLQIEGTLPFVTGAFGLSCAGVVVRALAGADVGLIKRPDRP